MNPLQRRDELSEFLESCGLNRVKTTKRYVVHKGWDEKHKIFIPLRGPVWVGPTLRDAENKFSTSTIKMYANAFARGPIVSGKRNMVTGKFAKPTVIDLVHPKPKPKEKPVNKVKRKPKTKVKTPAEVVDPNMKFLYKFASTSSPDVHYVHMHKIGGIKCTCPGFRQHKSCSHTTRVLAQRADVRAMHERTKIGVDAW
jgi:hypothetical protein